MRKARLRRMRRRPGGRVPRGPASDLVRLRGHPLRKPSRSPLGDADLPVLAARAGRATDERLVRELAAVLVLLEIADHVGLAAEEAAGGRVVLERCAQL